MSAPSTAHTPDQLAAIEERTGETPALALNRYRVTVFEWLSHRLVIDAPSAEEAESLAENIWTELGGDAFVFEDSGTDGYVVDLTEGGTR